MFSRFFIIQTDPLLCLFFSSKSLIRIYVDQYGSLYLAEYSKPNRPAKATSIMV